MCADCTTLQRLLEDSRASEQELVRTVEGLHFQLERSARAEQSARAELTKHREDSPKAKEIRVVLSHYVNLFGKTKAFKVGPDSERWRDVDKALRQHTVEELKEAIDGLHAMPFVGPHGRQASDGPGCDRYDEIDICLRNEKHVDRFRGYVEKAKAQRSDDGRAVYERALKRKLPSPDPPDFAVLNALTNLGLSYRCTKSGTAWAAQCPAHDDRNPSLSVSWNGAGDRLLVNCWVGCETVDVMAALGLPLAALFGEQKDAA